MIGAQEANVQRFDINDVLSADANRPGKHEPLPSWMNRDAHVRFGETDVRLDEASLPRLDGIMGAVHMMRKGQVEPGTPHVQVQYAPSPDTANRQSPFGMLLAFGPEIAALGAGAAAFLFSRNGKRLRNAGLAFGNVELSGRMLSACGAEAPNTPPAIVTEAPATAMSVETVTPQPQVSTEAVPGGPDAPTAVPQSGWPRPESFPSVVTNRAPIPQSEIKAENVLDLFDDMKYTQAYYGLGAANGFVETASGSYQWAIQSTVESDQAALWPTDEAGLFMDHPSKANDQDVGAARPVAGYQTIRPDLGVPYTLGLEFANQKPTYVARGADGKILASWVLAPDRTGSWAYPAVAQEATPVVDGKIPLVVGSETFSVTSKVLYSEEATNLNIDSTRAQKIGEVLVYTADTGRLIWNENLAAWTPEFQASMDFAHPELSPSVPFEAYYDGSKPGDALYIPSSVALSDALYLAEHPDIIAADASSPLYRITLAWNDTTVVGYEITLRGPNSYLLPPEEVTQIDRRVNKPFAYFGIQQTQDPSGDTIYVIKKANWNPAGENKIITTNQGFDKALYDVWITYPRFQKQITNESSMTGELNPMFPYEFGVYRFDKNTFSAASQGANPNVAETLYTGMIAMFDEATQQKIKDLYNGVGKPFDVNTNPMSFGIDSLPPELSNLILFTTVQQFR